MLNYLFTHDFRAVGVWGAQFSFIAGAARKKGSIRPQTLILCLASDDRRDWISPNERPWTTSPCKMKISLLSASVALRREAAPTAT
jgi:hypothetical protein